MAAASPCSGRALLRRGGAVAREGGGPPAGEQQGALRALPATGAGRAAGEGRRRPLAAEEKQGRRETWGEGVDGWEIRLGGSHSSGIVEEVGGIDLSRKYR